MQDRVILPVARQAVPQEQPVVVIVGGQPGTGKTMVGDLIEAVLERRGGAVRICCDEPQPGAEPSHVPRLQLPGSASARRHDCYPRITGASAVLQLLTS
ncbi:zeta toxin family protein [Streptomyces sp. NPDC001410]|uniref:zeta toxin family protein n=1 Tax=Streptomyces sp. NPDC001410 TaxID=3364574 RepID=UPI003684BC1E